MEAFTLTPPPLGGSWRNFANWCFSAKIYAAKILSVSGLSRFQITVEIMVKWL
jgi:hypothetical protein